MPTPREGDLAPDFTATTDAGDEVRLASFRGRQSVVLLFYPKDFTLGCTAEACAMRDRFVDIAPGSAAVYGISPDDAATHRRFRAAHHLPYPLIADPERSLASLYGAVWPLGMPAAVRRVSFVSAADGLIFKVIRHDLLVTRHATEVLRALAALQRRGEGSVRRRN